MIAHLLLQLVVVLLAAKIGGLVFRFLGQPEVVGEMAAGIVLGQFGSGWAGSTDGLYALSQIGLMLFLFVVGLRLNPAEILRDGRVAAVTSAASITAPFVLGAALGLSLHSRFGNGTSIAGFSLFLGASMSVTAFPVLARILRESNLEGTRIGRLAIACAAVDDVVAWLTVAGILAFVRPSFGHTRFLQVPMLPIAYCALMWFGLRKLARGWKADSMTRVLLTVFVSSLAAEWIGVHAFFGAFAAGVVMPKIASFTDGMARKIEPLAAGLLLPLFFTVTGFRAHIDLLQGRDLWKICMAIVCVAVVGKWAGAAAAARLMGLSWREASAIGVLLNTRGLVELIVLQIGIDAGLLSPTLYSMMVVMAMVTTLMTAPLLRLTGARWQDWGPA